MKIHLPNGSLMCRMRHAELLDCSLFLQPVFGESYFFFCPFFGGEGGEGEGKHCQIQSALNVTELGK